MDSVDEHEMCVTKRNGKTEIVQFDKILNRVKTIGNSLSFKIFDFAREPVKRPKQMSVQQLPSYSDSNIQQMRNGEQVYSSLSQF